MTGFLGRMIARAIDTAPRVSPRVPSRFELGGGAEPLEPTPAPDAAGTTLSDNPAATESPETPADAHRTSAPPGTPTDVPRTSAPPGTPADGPRAFAPPGTPADGPRAFAPRPAMPQARDTTQPSPRREDLAASHPEVAAPARRSDRAVPSDLPPVAPLGDPIPVAEATTRAAEPSRTRPAAPLVVRALPTTERADVISPLPQAADRSRPGERVASNSRDVVQISIGRVEVRATIAQPAPAPRPAPAKRPSAEALSLGDYLRGEREPS